MTVAFAATLNLVLAGTFVWTEMVSGPGALVLWSTLAGWWLAAALLAMPKVLSQQWVMAPAAEDLFPAALGEYLRGNWFEVERLCGELLARDGQDPEAQLMLATVCRRTGRTAESRGNLRELSRWDAAARWSEEIRREREELSDGDAESELAEAGEPAESADDDRASAELRPAA
jgi:hypothetical protein